MTAPSITAPARQALPGTGGHAALRAVLDRLDALDAALTAALERGEIGPDEAARRRTDHHALVRTITDTLEARA